jgi:acetyl esterase/lipase
MAASSLTGLYPAQDAVDNAVASNALLTILDWAIVHGPAYVTTDSYGTLPTRDGYGPDVTIDSICFQFDAGTCPTCLIHGQDDPYTPMGSTRFYRKLRQSTSYLWASPSHVPGEVHLYPGKGHEVFGIERGIEFLTQMGFMGTLQAEVNILDRYASDADCRERVTENVWPSVAQTPDYNSSQSTPEIEWFFPREKKTDAIQIVYSGGSYLLCNSESFEVAAVRRYLNEKGMTVVTLNYRTPRPVGLDKHVSAWQDLQRTIRLVRSQAASYGLDPDRIGIMGSSAGGHLTVMGATSSRHRAYNPVDAVDELSCKVQWAIACCPAYLLTDDWELNGQHYTDILNPPSYAGNATGGNADAAVLAPEFSFDMDTPPMLFMHGDADGFAAMNSVKAWEKLRSMGIPAEVHTYAQGIHEFMRSASPGTGRYTCLDRIGEFVEPFAF